MKQFWNQLREWLGELGAAHSCADVESLMGDNGSGWPPPEPGAKTIEDSELIKYALTCTGRPKTNIGS